MLLGAVTGFAAASRTASPALAILAAGMAGMGGALIYAVITVTLRGTRRDRLVLTIFGTGVAGLIGNSHSGISLPSQVTSVFKAYDVPLLSKIPVIGPMLFSQGIFVQAALVVAVLAHIYLNKTSFGLTTRMVGENPAAADASGINVKWYKYANILAGGFLCGVGGAFLSVVYVPRWQKTSRPAPGGLPWRL